MKSLVRQKFIDETWDATDLDAAARFWLRLYELTAANQKYSLPPKHALELRLWGFPRADAESLLSKLESLVKDSGSGSASLTLENPDKILLTTGVVSVANPPLAGLGLPWVNSSEFNGLVVEIRLRVRGHNRRRPRPLDVALVLTGVLFDGKLIAKAVWRCHRGWPEDETYRYARIQGEEAWLTALGEFKRAETVTEDRSGWLTPLSSRDEDGLTVWKMLNTRFGRPRLLGVTHRALILIAAVTCLVVPWPGSSNSNSDRSERSLLSWGFAADVRSWAICAGNSCGTNWLCYAHSPPTALTTAKSWRRPHGMPFSLRMSRRSSGTTLPSESTLPISLRSSSLFSVMLRRFRR